ncbi:phosphatase PAP2 family protein [Paraburkholderia terricola]|uniref:phosphatase PAP2 family protein n=1 Tax=Paraburkholderia terricola TaxID=169427 RepID=UPI00286C7AE0|nr:phosphatase PAP2 family protein [Paraburkholderia terricola]
MIDIATAQGLVSMPSFHTALAILFVYSLRRRRVLACVAIPLNLVMILSTPTQGGHYLADVFGGLCLSALTVRAYNAIARRRMIFAWLVPGDFTNRTSWTAGAPVSPAPTVLSQPPAGPRGSRAASRAPRPARPAG